jgi:AraC family transcriptional regulator
MAGSMFFYPIFAGDYICDKNYHVKRDTFKCFLLMYIKNGSGVVKYNEKTFSANSNDVILLDCHHPHEYYTKSGWETIWIHFDGNVSQQFFEAIYSHAGCVLPLGGSTVIPKYLNLILNGFKTFNLVPEPIVSCYIQRMLTDMLLASLNTSQKMHDTPNPINNALDYIKANCSEKLTINQLASLVNISPYHFSRLFKKETGYAPYEYVIKTRIDRAKTLLKTTLLNISEIAYEVGFNSESNFVRTFHSDVGITPSEFRSIPF